MATEDNKNVATPGTPAMRIPEGHLSSLEDAAKAGDGRAFSSILESATWQGWSPEDFTRAVRLALKAGAHLAARRISEEGAQRHPDDSETRKYARVLAPPKVVSDEGPPDPGIDADQEWLEAHRGEYRGRWVAVRGGKLLGVADSLKALVGQVGDTEGVLLTTGY